MEDILEKIAYLITEKAEAIAKEDKWIGKKALNATQEAIKISHLSQILSHEVRSPGMGVMQLEGYFQSIYLDKDEEKVAREFFNKPFNIEELRGH